MAATVVGVLRPSEGRYEILKVLPQDFSSGHCLHEILPRSSGLIWGQTAVGEVERPTTVDLPQVDLRVFANAVVRISSSAMVVGDSIVLNDPLIKRSDNNIYSGGLLGPHDLSYGLVDVSVAEEIESGIFLGGLGSFNWYHWMIELLPKASLVPLIPTGILDHECPLLVPEEVQSIPQFREALDKVDKSRPRVFLDHRRNYRVSRIYVIDPINWIPFNLRSFVQEPEGLFRQDVMSDFRNLLSRHSEIAESGVLSNKRYFLTRKANRRPYNEEAIFEVAQNYGFEMVDTGLLDLEEQASLFSTANFILGPSGANWTGLLFGTPKLTGLIWGSRQSKSLIAYPTLAATVGARLRYIYTDQHVARPSDLYGMPFKLDVLRFEQALKSLIGDA